MNNLKQFYKDAETNESLKQSLLKANEEAKGLPEEQIKEKIIEVAVMHGYQVTKQDFEIQEGSIEEQDLEKVAGGISAGCFFANAGCTFIGEIGKDGGCFILGLY